MLECVHIFLSLSGVDLVCCSFESLKLLHDIFLSSYCCFFFFFFLLSILPLVCVLSYISLFYILTELFVSDRVSTNLGAFLFFRKYSLCSKWVFLYWNSSSHRYVELSEYWFFLDHTCIYCLACETNLFLAFVNRRFKTLHTFTCK